MSFILSSTVYNTFNKSIFDKTEPITIINGEDISFDFSSELETGLMKVTIICNEDRNIVQKPFIPANAAIVVNENEWCKFSQNFSFSKEESNGTITIKLEYEKADTLSKTFDYNVYYKSLEELNVNFELIGANLTNNNKVSYLIKNKTTDTLIIVKTK